MTYGDVFHQNEVEQSRYNFEQADVATLLRHFDDHERACKELLEAQLALPAYEQVLKASHTFNLLDARRAISVTERQRYILRMRALARAWRAPITTAGRRWAFRCWPGGAGAVRRWRRGGEGRRMSTVRRDFLVELGTEELPPKALRLLQQAFAGELASGLAKAGLQHAEVASFATPRRLAVLVRRLAAQQPDQRIERRGPPVGAAFDAEGLPTRAAQAFAASCNAPVAALQRREEGKGTFLYYLGIKAGAPAVALLPGLVQSALDALPIPRRMRWGAGEAQFVRPVHWLVMLYGREVVPATLLGTPSGNLTRGHRFHAPRPIRLSSPAAYERPLRERGYVIADFEARRVARARARHRHCGAARRPAADERRAAR